MSRLAFPLVFLWPFSTGAAQIPFLDALVNNVREINFDYGLGKLVSSDELANHHLRSIGFELAFSVPGMGCVDLTQLARDNHLCAKRKQEREAQTLLRRECEASGYKRPSESACALSYKRTGREVSRRMGDSTVTVKYEAEQTASENTGNTGERFSVSIGVAYNRFTGFESRKEDLALSGTLEELPAITTYVALVPDNWIAPYVGVRAGLVRLSGFRGTPKGKPTVEASGDTYLVGGVVGVALGIDRLQVFAEYGLVYRHFSSLGWKTDSVSSLLPLELGASSRTVAFGFQLTIK
jgi:hypothetical protein